MKVYAFVPAKSTSSRIIGKNMKILAGERLFVRALKILLKCREVDKIFLDTDSDEMFRLIEYMPVEFMKRDLALCDNSTDGHSLFLNEILTNSDADIYVQLLCTSPFINPQTIDDAINVLKHSDSFDSALLIRKEKLYFWKDGQPDYGRGKIPNSIDLPESIIESMGLYIHKKNSALKLATRYGLNPYFISATPLECVDINTLDDFKFAETIALGLQARENLWFGSIKSLLTSALLSDAIDDLHVETGELCGVVLTGFQSNLINIRCLGRASTLKLRKLKSGEDFRGIYDALKSYENMTANNIICIENDTPDLAYFGDLNARLAIRAGASGAIINGITRDCLVTGSLNFPVLSKGFGASDVRRKATLDYMDQPISFGNHIISPGDLIFFDNQAVVVMYPKYEQAILSKALTAAKNEASIISDIVGGKNIVDICNTRGAF